MSSPSPGSPVGRYLQGLAALGRYPRAWLGADLVAGVTLGCVMVPVGLADGDLAGVPPVAGLYAAILPLVRGRSSGPCEGRSLSAGHGQSRRGRRKAADRVPRHAA